MKRFLVAVAALIATAVIVGCGEKTEGEKPAPVRSYKEYTDPSTQFKVSYPDGWVTSISGSRAVFYSTTEVADAFSTLEPKGQRGGKIEVMAEAGDASVVDARIAELKEVFTAAD